LIGPHACALLQVMSQLVPRTQSMLPQELALLHLIVQSNPNGHCTLPHGRPALQVIWQVPFDRSQDVQGLGQLLLARSTQYPWSQVRVVSLQSLSLVHANSLECRSTEQVVAGSAPSPISARTRKIAAGFITDLRGS
jgi:hypothetical protein